MSRSKIEWLHRPGTIPEVYNPVTGCTKVSAGCKNCYAARVAGRFWATQYPGFREYLRGTPPRARRFTDVLCHEDRLDMPLRWWKPRTVFVNSMSDLFHEAVPDEFIGRVFAVMESVACGRHVFIVLTKRARRMRQFVRARWSGRPVVPGLRRNVWLGVSVEDQATADERIPLLLQAPAAVRVVSAEPLLGPVDIGRWLRDCHSPEGVDDCVACRLGRRLPRPDWLIVGGESGPQARPCDVAWIRSLVQQARDAGVPCFTKQLGAFVVDRNDAGYEGDTPDGWPCDTDTEDMVSGRFQGDPVRVLLHSRKGGDPSEWPANLRVREWPR